MTLAALLAYLATNLVGFYHGYWAVITCLVIVQGSLGATISAGLARVAGTAAGAVMGGVGVLLLRLYLQVPEWVILMIVIVPMAVLAASKPIFRLAPLTAALILLLAGSGTLTFALSRVAEILLGTAIGVLVSLFVLPEWATSVLVGRAAAILEQLGEFAEVSLLQTNAPARERIAMKIRGAYAQIQNDMKEVENERGALLVRSDPFPERLLRHLQRLRTDVNMIGRAAASDKDAALVAELAASIKRQFLADARTLRGRAITHPNEELNWLPPAVSPETPMGFAIATLQQEFGELAQTLNDWIAHSDKRL